MFELLSQVLKCDSKLDCLPPLGNSDFMKIRKLPGGSSGKESDCDRGDPVQFLGREDSLEKGRPTHSSILAWRILWTGDPDGLQSMGS